MKQVDTNSLLSQFGLSSNNIQSQPVSQNDSIPPPTAKGVFDISNDGVGQFERQAQQAVDEARKRDEELARNYNQDASINLSLARLIDTINNTIILTQREAMRFQDPEILNTLVNAINAGQKMLSTLIDFRKQEQKLQNAKQLEEYKHKLAMEKMEKKAQLNPPKNGGSLPVGKQPALIGGGTGPMQVNINFSQDQKMSQAFQGKTLEEIEEIQKSLGVSKPTITYEEPDEPLNTAEDK